MNTRKKTDDNMKKVDEAWKEQVEEEKRGAPSEAAEKPTPAGVDFSLFLSTMGLQCFVALGQVAEPSSGQKSVNLDQAKYLIDMLGVIEEKTKGNLTKEEEETLTGLLYEVRMKFTDQAKASEKNE